MNDDQSKKAAFSFESYKINKFSFSEQQNEKVEYNVRFEPKGEYMPATGIFILTFKFKAFREEEIDGFINVDLSAIFKFPELPTLEELPSYFYRNSIALVFPYIRAFITTLTAVANINPMILPVLNLSNLEQPLRKNTSVVIEQE